MLKKLILSILACNINREVIKEVNLIVVDNDIDKTAEKVVGELTNELCGIYKLHYYNHPVKGLSNVRNELFRKAIEFNSDYIVGIDDDEYASFDWLNQLFLAITTSKAEIVLGPVISVFENNVPSYVSNLFKKDYPNLKNNQRVRFFSTCNFIICTKFVLKNKIRFDERFNLTGSEDTYFGVNALNLGANIFWAKDAIIYENIPDKRAKLEWLIKRYYNGAINYTYILKLEKEYLRLMKKFIINIFYICSGIVALIAILFPLRWKYWGILKISEGVGGFAGLFGIRYHEYAKGRP